VGVVMMREREKEKELKTKISRNNSKEKEVFAKRSPKWWRGVGVGKRTKDYWKSLSF
jgi:hypothetical protein